MPDGRAHGFGARGKREEAEGKAQAVGRATAATRPERPAFFGVGGVIPSGVLKRGVWAARAPR